MSENLDDVAAYDYELPPELIATEPAVQRDQSRLLVVDRSTQTVSHAAIRDLPSLLSPGDRLVLNNSRVVRARLRGVREATGGKWEGLFLKTIGDEWELLGQTRGRLQPGETIVVPSRVEGRLPLQLVLTARADEGAWRARPVGSFGVRSGGESVTTFDLLECYGDVPLPPYIRKGVAKIDDVERYQTVFADRHGSVAAPTAGLHFTDELLAAIERCGISRSFVTLHVGVGTFRPIATDRLSDHVMHSEWAELSDATAAELRATRTAGRRIVAVGTTSVRVLETVCATGEFRPYRGETNLFIKPGFEFRVVDALLTNFHLPRSSLLVLVSAFAGRELIRRAYDEAIRERYRFYSYGDAMLIL